MSDIDAEQAQHQALQREIRAKLEAMAADGGAQEKLDAEVEHEKDEARMAKVEATLESVGRIVHRTAGFLWFEGNAPADIEQTGGECNVGNLEEWMRIVEGRILEMLQASRTLTLTLTLTLTRTRTLARTRARPRARNRALTRTPTRAQP